MVFMGLVGVFFLCHILRVALNVHEMLVIDHAMRCFEAGKQGFPLWSLVVGKIRCISIRKAGSFWTGKYWARN